MVAIRGMEMPEDCWDCQLMDAELWCLPAGIPVPYKDSRPDWCPLVEAVTHEDYISMQQTCFKLQQALAEAAPHNNPEDSIREVKP